jgi:hypothetical protein
VPVVRRNLAKAIRREETLTVFREPLHQYGLVDLTDEFSKIAQVFDS